MNRLAFILVVLVGCGFAGRGQGWFPVQTSYSRLRANMPIGTMCTDSAGNLYAAGGFTESSHNRKCYVAKWDHVLHEWSELGTGANALNVYGQIYSIAVDGNGYIYAAGFFTYDSTYIPTYAFVVKWNGTTWSELGTGSNALNERGTIESICVDNNNNIYVAGTFRNSALAYYVAKWDGSSWSDLGGLNANICINSICTDDSFNVYAGGNFTDGLGHTYVAKYSPHTGSWAELGSGFDSGSYEVIVKSIYCDTPNHVCAAVNCYHGSTFSNIFRWDGINWSQLGNLNGNGEAMVITKGDSGCVYAAGRFTNSHGHTYVAKYDPQTNIWSELGMGANALSPHATAFGDKPGIAALCVDGGHHLYAGGYFQDSISATDNYFFVAEYGPESLGVLPTTISLVGVSVYPNPVTDKLNISWKASPMNHISYCLFDCMGRVFKEGSINAGNGGYLQINMEDLTAGFYEICIGDFVCKVVKE